MLKVGFGVFCTVKVNHDAPGFIRNSRRGFTTFVAMEEESLAILAVTGHHAVNVALRTAQSEGGPVFIGIGVIHQSLYYFVFFKFIH